MKIIAISDLHGYLPELPKCDIVCICGDISPLSIQNFSSHMKDWLNTEFNDWIESLDCKKVLLIAGNHDFVFEKCPELIKSINENQGKLHILHDTGIVIDDKLFYGTPWCPELCRWAFFATSKDLIKKFNMIPEGVDVLLTHCPPKIGFVGKVLQSNSYNYMVDYGCKELADMIEKKKPKYVFSEHVHTGMHVLQRYNNTCVANVSLKDESYNVIYDPLIIDL